ncbi:hypothetical protein OIU78_004723 [Salix suchowensis]|nr:hypothetical protein OIU78_004723 [Salix suchowensis]
MHLYNLYCLGPMCPTRNRSLALTCGTGTDLMQRKTRTSWNAGRLVTKWEKIAGIPDTSSVCMRPIPRTRTIPRLGPKLSSQLMETLFWTSNSYVLSIP